MFTESVLRVGTRASRLALWQTDHVIARLEASWPGLRVERVPITTLGDRVTTVALSRIGDKGLFTRELEDGLRSGAIDLAVHSLKDLPTELSEGVAIGAVLEREDPRDVLISRHGETFDRLPGAARIGTSSLRRQAQVAGLRPDATFVDLRGNVPTRLDKVTSGEVDAALLAYAGLRRLGLESRIAEIFDVARIVPAPGQGALAVQTRAGDDRLAGLLRPLLDQKTWLETTAERALLGHLEGGCQVPVGAHATLDVTGALHLIGLVASLDGRRSVRREIRTQTATPDTARAAGINLARTLLDAGAREILSEIRLTTLARTALEETGR
jgi:hydroxymethylbilane synthase